MIFPIAKKIIAPLVFGRRIAKGQVHLSTAHCKPVKMIKPSLDWLGERDWQFKRGMLFNDTALWWNEKSRPTPHEGIDFYSFLNQEREEQTIKPGTKVKAMASGQVTRIIPDFLGQTIFVAHDIYNLAGEQFFTIYAHIKPTEEITEGTIIREKTSIATIAESKRLVPAHLHISMGWFNRNTIATINEWKEVIKLNSFTNPFPSAYYHARN